MAPTHEAAMHGNLSKLRDLVERQGKDATALDGEAPQGADSDSDEWEGDEEDVPMAPAHYAAQHE
jgi:hypothetical protein